MGPTFAKKKAKTEDLPGVDAVATLLGVFTQLFTMFPMPNGLEGKEAWSALVTACERCGAWQMALHFMEESRFLGVALQKLSGISSVYDVSFLEKIATSCFMPSFWVKPWW